VRRKAVANTLLDVPGLPVPADDRAGKIDDDFPLPAIVKPAAETPARPRPAIDRHRSQELKRASPP